MCGHEGRDDMTSTANLTLIGSGSILDDPADLIVVPVNTVPGVMGAGLAKAFATKYPGLSAEHRRACNVSELAVGLPHAVGLDAGRLLILFPTKADWRKPSRLEWIESGLDNIAAILAELGGQEKYRSMAVPALGCGLGGLAWEDVFPLIVNLAERTPRVVFRAYPPKGPASAPGAGGTGS